jgi:anti-sigma regulatory factor (Ser/Thr protein kinase)
MQVIPDLGEVRRVRLVVAAQLRSIDQAGLVDEMSLLISEALTNAIEHACTAITVRLGHPGSVLRMEVDDDGAGDPIVMHPGPDLEAGRGMLIIDQVADRWGVDHHVDDHKTFWFEMKELVVAS